MVPTPYLHSAESVALDAVSIRVPVGNRWHTQKVAKQSLIKELLKMVWTGLRSKRNNESPGPRNTEKSSQSKA